MKNINWLPKYSIYPFVFPNGISGQIKVKDKSGVEVIINSDNYQIESFKNFEKAMVYVQTQLNKNL